MYYDYGDTSPVAGPNGKKGDKAKKAEMEKRCVRNALSLLTQVQELNVIEGEHISAHSKARKLLMQARQHIDDMIGEAPEKTEKGEGMPKKKGGSLPPAMAKTMAI